MTLGLTVSCKTERVNNETFCPISTSIHPNRPREPGPVYAISVPVARKAVPFAMSWVAKTDCNKLFSLLKILAVTQLVVEFYNLFGQLA